MKKMMKVVTTITLMLLMIASTVEAASFKFAATPSKTTVKPGEEIELTLTISDIDVGEEGINTIEGVLEYDKTVFEEVKSTSITSLNNWTVTYNDEDTNLNGKFLGVILSGGVKGNQTIGKIKLKVKANAKAQTTTIKINDIATNDGSNLIKETNKTISIKIEDSNANQNAANNNTTGSGQTNNTGNNSSNTGNNSNNTGNSSNTTINKINTNTNKANSGKNQVKLPQAGTREVYIISIIGIAAIIGIVCYIKYKKM